MKMETCRMRHEDHGLCELPFRHDGPHGRTPGGSREPVFWDRSTCNCEDCTTYEDERERRRKLGEAIVQPMQFETKDSGKRQQFETGSQRDSREGKGRYDLLPPHALQRVAQVYERGAAKYDDRNWEKGQPLCRFLDSALRHTFQALAGNTDEDHAAQAVFNLLGFIEIQHRINEGRLPKELDDLP